MWRKFDMKINYINDFGQWASDFKFSVPITVRFSEIDMYGILNNTVTFSYFEYARIEYLKEIGLMTAQIDPTSNAVPVIADAQCDYHKPIYYGDVIELSVKSNTVGNSSVDIHYLGKNQKDEVVFTGRGTMVQMSRETGKGFPWTEKEKSQFVM